MRHPKPPLSPAARSVLSAAGVTRRGLMRGVFAGGALALTGGALAACGTKPAGNSPGAQGCTATDVSATEKKLTFSNWVLYIDVDDNDEKKRPTLDAFSQQSGLAVTYQEDINDNNEFYGKISPQLQACQSIDRDIIVLTDWMAARLVRLGWVQKLDPASIPNVGKNILPNLKGRAWDPDGVYAAPWQSGLTGIAYNGSVTKELRTLDELFTRPDLKGKIAVLSEMRDTMGAVMLSMGKDPSNFTDADFDAALDKLKKAVDSGQIRKFTGNDYKEDLAKGDLAACLAWSGDVIQLNFEDENVKFVIPDEGLTIFSDNMQVPATATHKANAEKLIDYYYDPKVAAEVAAWVNYICPVAGAQEAMKDIDEELVENPLIFPDQTILSKAKGFKPLTEAEDRRYASAFESVAGS